MGIFCAQCEVFVRGGIEELKEHMIEEHHDGPYLCTEEDCDRRKFKCRTSFYRHLRDHHEELCFPSNSASQSSDSATSRSAADCSMQENDARHEHRADESFDESDEEDDEEVADAGPFIPEELDDFATRIKRAAALLILDLRKSGNVTGKAISLIADASQKLINSILTATLDQIATNLENAGVDQVLIDANVKSLSIPEPFRRLKTKAQQIKYFKENFSYVEPTSKFLMYKTRNIIDKTTGTSIPRQVRTYCQYVNLRELLTAVLNNEVLFNLIHAERKSTDGKLRGFLDGTLAEDHPLISLYPFTIRINVHSDDYQVANPLGSKTIPHKIVELHIQIQNLPPEENARLRSVFVLAYAYRDNIPIDEGLDALLRPFLNDLAELETPEGVVVRVRGRPYTLRATLESGSADDLAAHELLGLHSPSCTKFCSVCMLSRSELRQDILSMGEMRNKDLHLFHIEELARRPLSFTRKTYGVMRNSMLLQRPDNFPGFHQALIKDGMHDILKGVAPMEMKLALHEFCFVQKYFDVPFFNTQLISFNYGPADKKNIPSPNFTSDSVNKKGCYTMHQTASQIWCLLRAFPFLIGDRVPIDNPHLRLVVLLKRISEIIFSHVVSEPDLQLLDTLLQEHHVLFFTLYPPNGQQEEHEVGDEDEDEVEDENFLVESEPEEDPPLEPESDQRVQKKKKPKVIRPINKHHHLLHYADLMRKFGPAVLYWCMRFEGKHALPKRFGAIVNCFKNLPVTFADLQQMNLCSELMSLVIAVKSEVAFPKGLFVEASQTPYLNALCTHGLERTDVLEELKEVTIAGFLYRKGLYVNLPLSNGNHPQFGLICSIYTRNGVVYIVTKDCTTVYDERYGAFLIHNTEDNHIRVFLSNDLPPDRPIAPWISNNLCFLSTRRTLAECLMGPDQETD